jgi:hypothetical protein
VSQVAQLLLFIVVVTKFTKNLNSSPAHYAQAEIASHENELTIEEFVQ